MKLQEMIAQYVAFRESMGEEFESAESLLNTFSRRMGLDIDVRYVRAKQVRAFLTGNGPITRYWRRKYDALRGLYRFATSRSLVTKSPLPISVPKMPERFVPYIYTRDKLRHLLDSTAVFPKYPRKLQAHTLRAILPLYGAGLRVSESVALTLEDVDLPSAVITIRTTKFNKTRLVPLGLELNRVMAQYAAGRAKAGHAQTGSAPFFVLRRGGPVPVQLVEQRFKYLREHAGVSRADGARCQPRLHDLRQHADSPIMPTTKHRQRLGGARIVSRVGIIRGSPGTPAVCHRGGIVLV